MASLNIEELEDLEKRFSRIDTEEMMRNTLLEISSGFKDFSKNTFITKKSPFGKKWQKSKSNPNTLIDTADLFNSVNSVVRGNKVVLFAGQGLDYAKIHNDGIGIMPMREFIPSKGKIPVAWRKFAEASIEKNYNSKILKKSKK